MALKHELLVDAASEKLDLVLFRASPFITYAITYYYGRLHSSAVFLVMDDRLMLIYTELAYLENGSEFAIHQKGYEPTEVYEHSLLEGSGDI